MNGRKEDRRRQVGIDRMVRLKWLEQTAALVRAGNGYAATKQALEQSLAGYFQAATPTKRGSLDKTVTILLRTWLTVPDYAEELRTEALKLLDTLPAPNRLAIHWGMLMAVYPFWASVAAQVGRLLRLQGSVTAAQIQRRICEQYGERETVYDSVRRALRSYVDWKVLSDTDRKGTYQATRPQLIQDRRLVAWILEALMCSQGVSSYPLNGLLYSPVLFPFKITPPLLSALDSLSNLEITSQGSGERIVQRRSVR